MVGWFHSTSRVAIVVGGGDKSLVSAVSCHVQLERTGPYQTSGDHAVLKMVQRQPSGHISPSRRFQLECADCRTVVGHSKRGGVIPIYLTQLNLRSIPEQGELNDRDEQEKRVYRARDFGGLH